FASAWLPLYPLLVGKRLGIDGEPSADGAWVGSYFLTSIVGTAACVAFGTSPRTSFWRTLVAVFLVTGVTLSLVAMLEGPRHKSEPPFGEKPIDVVFLTAPAVVAGLFILAWRVLRVAPGRSAAVEGAGRDQP